MRRQAFLLAILSAPLYAAPFHFAIIGDRTGRAVAGVYEETWREVAAGRPDFVITVGDAIEGWNRSRARAEWESVSHAWMPQTPVYQTPGNHDIWDAESEKLFTKWTGDEPFYSFDFQHAHFVVLDNSRTEDLAAAQLRFLESDLAKNRGKTPTLIFFHRPFWLIPLKLGASGFVLQKIALQYGVCCVVSGHGHQLQTLVQDGVRYLEVGSSGASLAGAGPGGLGFADGWFYQYVWATVDGNAVRFEVRELKAPFGKGRTRELQASGR